MPAALPSIAPKKVGMISLGCAKNLVDAEIMLGSARAQGLEITADADEADVLIVNTCAFIDSAKEESIEAILEAHRGRGLKRRAGQRLIVSGCMAQRFSANLQSEMPEVDAFMGLDQVADAGSIISQVLSRPVLAAHPPSAIRHPQLVDDAWQPLNLVTRKPRYIPDYDTPRFRLTPKHIAYVKIAEGCNHPCSFCVIPQMRGKHRSRTIESVVHEVRDLVADGVKEINLITQDTTYFGMDLWEQKAGPTQPVDSDAGRHALPAARGAQRHRGRFLDSPALHAPGALERRADRDHRRCRKVARYVDMPLQHIHPEMLERMRRETSSEHIVDLIARIRAGVPGIALRTTFIVGFPGETEEHFAALLEFIESTRFERLGIFTYSREEGSRAAKMDQHVHAATKRSRYGRAMALQQRIARGVCLGQVGRRLRVLVESPLVARSEADAPDIDGRVILDRPAPVGEFIEVEITGTQIYDLVARQI